MIFSYRRIRAESGYEAKLATMLVTSGIPARVEKDGCFIIAERDIPAFKKISMGRIRYSISEPMGLGGALRRSVKDYSIILTIIFGILLNYFLTLLVWDVRVSGNERLGEEKITDALSDCGFGVGSFWWGFDGGEYEMLLCERVPELAWVQINRRGTVAYVEVIERSSLEVEPDVIYTASNIVATHDCVIEEITVYEGRALVKPGDVVKKGDMLISGIVEDEGGVRITRASGSVRGHIAEKYTVNVGEIEEEKVSEKGELSALTLNIFSLPLNIFKNYGNSSSDCDIIKEKDILMLPGGLRLPVSLSREYSVVESVNVINNPKSSLPSIAGERLVEGLHRMLEGRDLISLKTEGTYLDGGYQMDAYIVYCAEIGSEVEIELDN